MKAIMVMFDSLRKDVLPCYGGSVDLPNFRRLAKKTVIFDRAYVCSLPCMPARKELHTGRPNLLHRSWGPIEPFEDSMPELLSQAGIHTHLATDHYHYIQDGGATYHERYSTWECFRGQESDKWIGEAVNHGDEFAPCIIGSGYLAGTLREMRKKAGWQNAANRKREVCEANYPQAMTFEAGLAFLKTNVDNDNWFLQIETFDPHEPFDVPDTINANWFDPDQPDMPDWPPYSPVRESPEFVEDVRKRYYGLVQFCDKHLGYVLDFMDAHDMWKDTMLIVNTDHGFLNGEHGWWGKGVMPDYEDLVNIPFFVWDPRCGMSGVHRSALVQTIDIAPTLLDYFGLEIPKDMTGRPLKETVANDKAVREYAFMGYFGSPLDITDGRYKLMKAVTNPTSPLYEYTQMPTHMNRRFSLAEMRSAALAKPFTFTKGTPTMRIVPDRVLYANKLKEDLLYDLEQDPAEAYPIDNPQVKARLLDALTELFRQNDAPLEQYDRYGLKT